MTSIRKVAYLFLFVVLCFEALGQNPSYYIHSVENGAPSNEVYCLLEDQSGYIWFGCDAGIYRFNGAGYKRYSSPLLEARSATGLIQSNLGKIYGYNFKNQLFVIEDDSMRVITEWKHSINGVQSDGKGNLWISGLEGLFKFNEKTKDLQHISTGKERRYGINYVTDDVCTNDDGTVYCHNNGQILLFKNDLTETFELTKNPHNLPCGISSYGNTTWIVSFQGDFVYRIKNGRLEKIESPMLLSKLQGRKVTDVYHIRENELWLATYSGVIHYDANSDEAELLFENTAFSSVLEDSNGSIWLGTLHDGVYLIPNLAVRFWSGVTENTNVKERLTGLIQDKTQFYAAGSSGYISIVDPKNKKHKRIVHLPTSDMGMMYYDKLDDRIYFNKIEVLYELKGDKIDVVNGKMPPLKALLHDEQGYLLLTSVGLFDQKDLKQEVDLVNTKIANDWFRDIAFSPFQSGYFLAANNGCYHLLNKGKGRSIKEVLLKGKQILTVDSDVQTAKVYLYESSGKLYEYDGKGEPKVIRTFDQHIRPYLIRVKDGLIYLASNQGLLILDPSTGGLAVINTHDGLPSNNVTGIQFDDAGKIWVSTGKGICTLPLEQTERPACGKLIVNGLWVNNVRFSPSQPVVLDFDETLIIEADGLSYTSNGDYHFAYRLSGSDRDWIDIIAVDGKIRLPNLPAGENKIYLKFRDHKGRDSVNYETFSITVIPPFWQRWWFYLLIALVVGAVGYYIFRRRIKVLRMKQREALQKLKLENELRLTQQSALKAQMNPHFIFNVLNSIKGYIYESDKQNAIRYLSDFSGLVRKVLDMSSKTTVTLREELDAVEHYIHLEAMLLDSDFNYEFELEDNVDADFIRVPALIVQPYIENAFKHGLRHKQGAKFLTMSVRAIEENIIEIVITDNGIGRRASAEINSRNIATHESFASEASKKRIDLLNHQQKELVGVEIVDNFDQVGNASGTTVIIRIHV